MPPEPAPSATARPGRGEILLLLAILAVAALVRLWRLDLMEFKSDEMQACALGWGIAAGRTLPLVGLRASVGIPNPPLFVYLLAVPLRLSFDPLGAAAFIALSNLAAVWLCWLVGRRYFSPWTGLAASALFALAPWAVVFSRKIWAQDLLPLAAGLFLWAALDFLVGRRPRSLAWAILIAAAAAQLHFSALVLWGLVAYLIHAGRAQVRLKWVSLGLGASLALYAPYLWYLARTHGADFSGMGARREMWAGVASGTQRLLLALRYPLAISGGDTIDSLLGFQPSWARGFAVLTGLGALAGLIGLCLRDREGPLHRARVMLLLWALLPSAALIVTGVVPFIHYFIILYPLPFLGLAAALDAASGRWRERALGVIVVCVAGFAWIDLSAYQAVAAQGGAPGDYGVAYRDKLAAVEFAVSDDPSGRPPLWDGFNPNHPVPPEYLFLEAWRSGASPEPRMPPSSVYVLFDRFRSELTERGRAATRAVRQRRFGPLTVYVLPLKR